MTFDFDQVRSWRLARQHLDARAEPGRELEVVSRLCGLHAQLASSAELALWARVRDLQPGFTTDALFSQGTLVKTWAMRGTLHLLPAAELGLWLSALGTYDHYLKPAWSRAFGFTPEQVTDLVEAIERALAGGPLTRAELAERVGDDRLSESWGAVLKPAAFQGRLCFAEGDGQRVRFTAPPPFDPMEPGEALAEVARRFLGAYGPATREDFARWWAGLSPARSAKLLAGVAVEVELAGARAWVLPEHAGELDEAAEPGRTVRLLPAFDPWVVGATLHAEQLMTAPERDRVYRPQGWLSPVVLVQGSITGVWRHERKGRRLVVAVEPFRKLPAWAKTAVEDEAVSLAAFLGGELELSWA